VLSIIPSAWVFPIWTAPPQMLSSSSKSKPRTQSLSHLHVAMLPPPPVSIPSTAFNLPSPHTWTYVKRSPHLADKHPGASVVMSCLVHFVCPSCACCTLPISLLLHSVQFCKFILY
jgi:hypothetical protein